MNRTSNLHPWSIPLFVAISIILGSPSARSAAGQESLVWHTDYATAMTAAKDQGQDLLVFFHSSGYREDEKTLVEQLPQDEQLAPLFRRYVAVRVPIETRVSIGGEATQLVRHPAFAELHHQPGLALVCLHDEMSDHYHDVTAVFPTVSRLPTKAELAVWLDLPHGSLTQRMLVFAVRTHPEAPRSTAGEKLPVLVKEALAHSEHQASITLQGHHQWETRFHRINSQLPAGAIATEVCAESWPGQSLFEAALECVRSWRHSSGHWNAVRSHQSYYGYDMRRGRNGVWYATGIFGRGR